MLIPFGGAERKKLSQLYWSCSENVVEELHRLLTERSCTAKVLGTGKGRPIISVADPNPEALGLTAELLSQEQIWSAALTSGPLPENKLWIVIEWRGRMVVERSQVVHMEPISERWQDVGEHRELDLAIFEIRKAARSTEKDFEPQDLDSESIADVRSRPQDYYGDFTDPLIGGATALYAAGMEAARARGLPEGRIFVGAPGSLGFSVDPGTCSVTAWRRDSVIKVQAVGFSLSDRSQLVCLLDEYGIELGIADFESKVAVWHEQGFHFGVGLVLQGIKDPPVVIPVGSVYQQPSIGSSMQNLAIAQAANPMVAAGATVPLILPAWCLNRSLSPPSGPLAPTPLIAAGISGTQEMVWENIQRRFRGSR